MKFSALSIPLLPNADDARWIVQTGASHRVKPLDPALLVAHADLPSGWLGIEDEADGKIAVKAGNLRLVETVVYEWQIHGPQAKEVSVSEENFAMAAAREWTFSGMVGDAPAGRFQMLNFLGLADILFEHGGRKLVTRLEFVSAKIDYDEEYSAMTEEIADFCAQLLLSWNTPTSLRFEPDPEAQKRTKLEQFLFLRYFLNDAKFDACLEMIHAHPHRELKKERQWVPATEASSVDFLQNPMALARSWHRSPNGAAVPGEVCEISKLDDLDTPPNRFVKFALEQFIEVCREVQRLFVGKEPPPQAFLEARALAEKLEATVARPFFKECGRLQRLPLESQVLQKKEGYRDILKAWLLLRSASALRWDGRGECYTGTSRNVAELYEYWVFLTLHSVLSEVSGVKLLSGEDSPVEGCQPFLKLDGEEVKISLEKGKESRVRFIYRSGTGEEMCLRLYYERRFLKNGKFSWSGSFKPDYTLVMFPAEFGEEEAAAKEGRLSLLHFDAKYKAEKLAEVFGDWMKGTDSEEESAEDGSNEANRLYKQVDLLKMHTYNDAIKATAGSYVLYPGLDDQPEPIKRYHEILPGVGAFVLKPGTKGGREFLKQFLSDVFEHQADQFTQYRYASDATFETVKDGPDFVEEAGTRYTVTRKAAPAVVHWMKASDMEVFRDNGFAYCHAVYGSDAENKPRLQLDLSTEIGSEFIPCGGGQGAPLLTYGWRGKITGVKFLTSDRLRELLEAKGFSGRPSSTKATHYLFFEFDEISSFPKRNISEVARNHQSGSAYMAFTCRLGEVIASPAA